ncbi:MAG: hypothetical protein EOO10_10120 [Chitinophagaceae bacterium]|nr:MAG: hypothetical protein EOO10_10120 [Chitinophagaceae bacterium]
MLPKIAGNKQANFTVASDADVYVAYQFSKPGWLKDFTDTKDSVVNSEGTVYRLYKKRAVNGAKISLEVSQSDLYSVFAVPATTIEPAYDLKPVSSYKAALATIHGPGLKKGQVDGKDRAIFETASAQNMIEWNFTTGVADIYSMTVSYNNPHETILKGKLQLLSADGTLMKEETVQFTPTRVGKSNYITTNTGSMINAGHYKVRLTAPDAAGLSLNALDVQ